MKRTSALAVLTVAALGLSACGFEDSNDASGSDSSANSSAQQESAAKGEGSKKDDTKKSGPNPTVPGASDQAPESSPGDGSSSEPRRNARTTPSKVGGACGTTAEGAKLKAHEATSCEFV